MRAEKTSQNVLGFRVVELTDPASLPVSADRQQEPLPPSYHVPTNMIGVGDILGVAIYEAGVALFGGGGQLSVPGDLEGIGSSGGSSGAEVLPLATVDESGYITIPYVGRVKAEGQTTQDLENLISTRLRSKSQSPQVLVSIRQPVANGIIVGGEVMKPGRLALSTGQETLLDAVALAGGYKGEPADLIVRLERNGKAIEERLSKLARSPIGATRVSRGDNIEILRQPLSFSVFGAPGKVDLIPFGKDDLSLAEAVARSGGSSPNAGDPAAIFVFRYDLDGQVEKPVIYHLNMMKAGSYFLAQKFAIKDRDVLYIGNAKANQPSKLIQIISQLFTPIVMVRSAVNSN